jgi:putative DNA primase/helicase
LDPIPADLTERDQWVVWRKLDGRKVPYQVNGERASSTDPLTWNTFEEVDRALHERPRFWAGLGFVFSPDDPFVGIDVDKCLTADCTPKPWARGLIERFYDTYCEISPSGSGVKIWARGALQSSLKVSVEDGAIEMYDRARYFAVTARAFNGSPLQIEEHRADINALYEWLRASSRRRSGPVPNPDGRIPYGQQHNTLIRILGSLRAWRVCDEAALACLLEVNARQCERPGPIEHIEQMVRSTRTWAER